MVYIKGPFRDAAGVPGTGSALVEQNVSFEAADGGGVYTVPRRAYMENGELFEDAQHSQPLNVPLPPFGQPVFLTLQFGAAKLPRQARTFPTGTVDTDSVFWTDMIPAENPDEPTQWVIPGNIKQVYDSVEDALDAAAASAASASAALAAQQVATQRATEAGTAATRAGVSATAAQRAAAATRGRIVILQPDPFTIDGTPGGTPILPNGRPVYMDPGSSDDPETPTNPGLVEWGGILNVPELLAQIGEGSVVIVLEGDPRLTDARTPLAHLHTIEQVNGLSDALGSKAEQLSVDGITSSLNEYAKLENPVFVGDYVRVPDPADDDLSAAVTVGWFQAHQGAGGTPTVPPATEQLLGAIKLTGDLAGSADNPRVPALADKVERAELADYATIYSLSDLATIVGAKAEASEMTTALAGKASTAQLAGKQDKVDFTDSADYLSGEGVFKPKTDLPVSTLQAAAISKTRGGGGPLSVVTWSGTVGLASDAFGRMYTATLSGNVTLTLINGPAVVSGSGDATTITFVLKQGTGGSKSVTWPSTVKWPGVGAKPTLTTAAGGIDYVTLVWDGVEWLGFLGGATFA